MTKTASLAEAQMRPARVETDARGVAVVTMDRPAVRNAWNPSLVTELTLVFERLAADPSVRVAIVTGAGPAFSAGGDLGWMRGVLEASEQERQIDADRILALLETLDSFPKPLIARVNGAAFGGGVGIVCAADVAVASEDARFGLSEARVGVIPALISPFVLRRLGLGPVRSHLYGGASISAETARSIGLVREAVPHESLDTATEDVVAEFLACGHAALAATKSLLFEISRTDEAAGKRSARDALLETWRGREAREGLSAFIEKRKPPWAAG